MVEPTSQLQLLAHSLLVERSLMAGRLGKAFNGQRNYYDEFGYEQKLEFRHYYDLYSREHIAGRIVDMPADATWKGRLELWEDEEPSDTAFEQAWKLLERRLRVSHYFKRLDRLAGIGRYAVLLIGVRGGSSLNAPLRPSSLRSPESVLYLQPFSEKNARVSQWVDDSSSPRYGQPLMYELDYSGTELASALQKREVHHSRVLHVAEHTLEDDAHGMPRLQRVHNLFQDLAKIIGGSAEMFWLSAQNLYHADADKEFDWGKFSEAEKKELADQIEEMSHKLRRFIRTQGIEINELGGRTPDPRGVYEPLKELIAGAAGIPQRILFGSERGELASSMDQGNWHERIEARRSDLAEPVFIRPFVERLQWLGVLPAAEYQVGWSPLATVSPDSRAGTALKLASAAARLSPEDPTRAIAISEFREALELPKDLPQEAPPEPPASEEEAGTST